VRSGVDQTIQYAVPAPPTRELLSFVAAGVWMSAWLADAALLWVGNPLLSIAASVPLFATPSTLLPSQRRWLDTGLYLAAAAWILFGEERARAKRWRTSDARLGWRPAPAVRVALVGLLVIIVMTPFLPGYGAPPLLRTKGPGDRVAFNPFVAIRATLQKQPEATLFSVITSRPMYMRLTTLDHYDGDVWAQGNARTTEPIGSIPIAADQPQLPSNLIKQDVLIQALAGPWIPAAYDPVAVSNVDDVKIERESRALVLPQANGLPVGVRYQVISSVPDISAADLDKPFSYDAGGPLGDYLQLPRVPSAIRSLAEKIAGDKPTPYQKALALQDYLRTFTYNQNVALHHSFKNLVDFLTKVKEGYCEQFAASMAVMARVLGIPSRVAIGFGLGDQIGNRYVITTKEAHAWVEIYFPGSGWVAFEPTPRAGIAQVPPYATPGAANPTSTPTVEPTVSATPSTQQSTASRDPRTATAGRDIGVQQGRPAWVFVAVVGVIVVGGIVLLIALAIFVPRFVRRRARGVRSEAAVRYVEFLVWCEGAGLGRHRAETPSEHAARLREDSAGAAEALNRLVALVDDALWAPQADVDPREVARAAEEARGALRSGLSRRSRVLAAAGFGRWTTEI
jgi:transglutaminase-like putative cysteine protease